jgi:hypothetical protein
LGRRWFGYDGHGRVAWRQEMVLLVNKKLPLSLPDLNLFVDAGISSHGGFLVAMFFLLEVAQSCYLFV